MELWKKVVEGAKGISTTNVAELEHDDWLELRRTGIGGSDAGAINGMNDYATPLTVYLDKKGLRHFNGNAYTSRGQRLEPVIREWTRQWLEQSEMNESSVETVPVMFTKEVDGVKLNANLDGLVELGTDELMLQGTIISGLGGLEIKTSGSGKDFNDDEIPASYYCQVQHYMSVTGLKWFLLVAYILNADELKFYAVPRNEVFIGNLTKAEVDFWNENVAKGIPPKATGKECEDDALDGTLNIAGGKTAVEIDDEMGGLLDELQTVNRSLEELKGKQEGIKEKIKSLLFVKVGGDKSKSIVAKNAAYSVTWSVGERKSVDTVQLKKDGLYDKYSKVSTSTALRVSEVGKKKTEG